jgi:DNA-binding GntR family transcriptional regulator
MGRSLRSSQFTVRAARKPRKSKQVSQRVTEAIRERILGWQYPPNHHLNERELCDEFSASRIPVREALNVLVEQGLVQRVPNQGCYVKQPDLRAVHELYDLRLALELFVVEQLARTVPPSGWIEEERGRWEPLLKLNAAAALQSAELLRADENFHLGLARALDNTHIFEALTDLYARIRFVRLTVSTNPDRVRTTAADHLEILEAVGRRDAEGARRAMWRNINEARNKVETALTQALAAAVWSRPPHEAKVAR